MVLARHALCASLMAMLVCLVGCPGAEYLWEVRTESTTKPASFNPIVFEQQPVAVLQALTAPGLHGNEVGLALSFSRTLKESNRSGSWCSPKRQRPGSIKGDWRPSTPA